MENAREIFPPRKENEPVVYDLDSDVETVKGETMLIGPELVEKYLDDLEKNGELKSDRDAIRAAINMLPESGKEALIRENEVKKAERARKLH